MIQENNCIACGALGVGDTWNDLSVLVCPNCSLAWRTSFDLPKDYYQTVAVDDSAGKKVKRERNTKDQISMIRQYLPKSRVWDLGAGDGTFLLTLKNLGYEDCVGVEPGENGLKVARERDIAIVKGMIEDLPVLTKGKKVLAVTMFHLIEHLSNPKESLATIRSVLVKDGVLVIETPNATAPIQSVTNHCNHLVYPEHLYYWTEQSLQTILEQSGFDILDIKRRSFDWQNAPIKNSLMRLGLLKTGAISSAKVGGHESDSRSGGVSFSLTIVPRKIIRSVLAHLVHILRRDDYVMVIAKAK